MVIWHVYLCSFWPFWTNIFRCISNIAFDVFHVCKASTTREPHFIDFTFTLVNIDTTYVQETKNVKKISESGQMNDSRSESGLKQEYSHTIIFLLEALTPYCFLSLSLYVVNKKVVTTWSIYFYHNGLMWTLICTKFCNEM